jgi:hypothetical protein
MPKWCLIGTLHDVGPFLPPHISTVAYALVNQSDWQMVVLFGGNAFRCQMETQEARGFAKLWGPTTPSTGQPAELKPILRLSNASPH